MPELGSLTTESYDPSLSEIDSLSTLDRLRLMNEQDQTVAVAVSTQLPQIAKAVEYVIESFSKGARLVYVGAGTSGRLAVLDASECPPTFGVSPEMVVAIIAGGPSAMFEAVEGAEDDSSLGALSIDEKMVTNLDTVIGISASGQAPFVIGALKRAREIGAKTVALTNNSPSLMDSYADIAISPVVGAEFISGSTRLKSGTSQKLVLNLITTNAMIGIGKTYGNLMVDVKSSNSKLHARAQRIVMLVTGADAETALAAMQACENNAKLAILSLKTGLNNVATARLLDENSGFLRRAIRAHVGEGQHR